jgi:hypothetical protein
MQHEKVKSVSKTRRHSKSELGAKQATLICGEANFRRKSVTSIRENNPLGTASCG